MSPASCISPTSSYSSMSRHYKHEDVQSYDDVMDLISQAKEVSASIDKTMKDMKHHFLVEDDNNDDRVVKSVRFAPDSRNQIEYIQTPSPLMCRRLYYNDEEYQAQLQQLQADLEQWDMEDPPESQYFTSRGLERRTVQGAAQRMEWRTQCRDRVLDEQDRQWMELPIDEPVDEEAIALICLATTRDAREAAYQQGLLDQQVVYGAEVTSQDQSTITLPTFCGESCSMFGESASLMNWSEADFCDQDSVAPSCVEEEDNPLNSKGQCVHWPPNERWLKQVFYVPHVETQEERDAYWYPNWTEEDAKELHREVIAHLATPKSNPLPRGESLRGLESKTPLAEAALEQTRLDLLEKVFTPELQDDPELLARQCQRLTARAKKEARARAMMDQRAVKEDEEKRKYNQKKKTKAKKTSRRSKEAAKDHCFLKRSDTKSVRKSLREHLTKSLAVVNEDFALRRSPSLPCLRDLDTSSSDSPFYLPQLQSSNRNLPHRQSSCPSKVATPSTKRTEDVASISSSSTHKTTSSLTRRLSQSEIAIPEDLFEVDTTDGDSVTFELPRRKPRRKTSSDTATTVASHMSWDEKVTAPWNIKPYSFDYNKVAAPRRSVPNLSSSSKKKKTKAPRRSSCTGIPSTPSFDYKKVAVPPRPKPLPKKSRRASLPDLLARLDQQDDEEPSWALRDDDDESEISRCRSEVVGRLRGHRRY